MCVHHAEAQMSRLEFSYTIVFIPLSSTSSGFHPGLSFLLKCFDTEANRKSKSVDFNLQAGVIYFVNWSEVIVQSTLKGHTEYSSATFASTMFLSYFAIYMYMYIYGGHLQVTVGWFSTLWSEQLPYLYSCSSYCDYDNNTALALSAVAIWLCIQPVL